VTPGCTLPTHNDVKPSGLLGLYSQTCIQMTAHLKLLQDDDELNWSQKPLAAVSVLHSFHGGSNHKLDVYVCSYTGMPP